MVYRKCILSTLFVGFALMTSPAFASQCVVDCGTTCSAASVGDAVKSAGANGTVTVPAGSCTWSRSVSLSRGIKIVGAGVGKTNISRSGTLFDWNPSSTARANREVFELSGFTFDGNSGPTLFTFTGPYPTSSAKPAPALVKFHDNTVRNSGLGGFVISIAGDVYGVIYNNTFDRLGEFIQYLGDSGGSYCSGWYHWKYRTSWAYATDEALYLEDNVFQYSSNCSSCTDPAWIELGWGAPGIVVRYNTYDFANQRDVGEIWDTHGLQNGCQSGQCSTQKVEYYGNILKNFPSGWARLQNDRGSWAMMFNNKTSGATAPFIDLYGVSVPQICDDEGGCSSVLPGVTQQVNNSYFWNNYFGSSYISPDINNNECSIAANRDYWSYNASCTSGSCSSGVGVGTSAPTGTCTAGVGFWVSSQGTALPSNMADLRTYTQAGKFYKCVSTNNWQPYYSPYTYPHPLRGSGSATIPASPSNLHVVGQ